MARYRLTEADVSAYVQITAGAVSFVPPKESSCLYVQYDVLFEEINKYVSVNNKQIPICVRH